MVTTMARLARVVAPRVPHHITQRGNRRQQTFFCEGDYEGYVQPMAERCQREGVEVWGYCLMPSHVHLIAVPESAVYARRENTTSEAARASWRPDEFLDSARSRAS